MSLWRHSTKWLEMEKIIADDSLKPFFTTTSTGNPYIKFLGENDFPCIFFTNKTWSPNRFGEYSFEYDSKDLIENRFLLKADKFNSAECYIAANEFFIDWIIKKCGGNKINPQNNRLWEKSDKEGRVDIILVEYIPLSESIDFNSFEKDSIYISGVNAKARFISHSLLNENKFIQNLLTNDLSLYVGFFGALFGGDYCRKYLTSPSPRPCSDKEASIKAALGFFANGEDQNARQEFAKIGDEKIIIEELLKFIATVKKGIDIKVDDVYNGIYES